MSTKDRGRWANPVVALVGVVGLTLGIVGAVTDTGGASEPHAAAPPLNIPASPHDAEFRAAYQDWGNECGFLSPARLEAQMHYFTAHQPTKLGFSPMTPEIWENYGYVINDDGLREGRPGEGDPGDINAAVAAQALYSCKLVYDEMPLSLWDASDDGLWSLSLLGQLGGRTAMFAHPRPQSAVEYLSEVGRHRCHIAPEECNDGK